MNPIMEAQMSRTYRSSPFIYTPGGCVNLYRMLIIEWGYTWKQASRDHQVSRRDHKGYSCFEGVKCDRLTGWREGPHTGPSKRRLKRILRHKIRAWEKSELSKELAGCE